MNVRTVEHQPYTRYESPQIQRTLKDEIYYLREYYFKEGLPHNWYVLPATGFQVDKQTNLLFSQLNTDDTPTERFFQKQTWLEQTDGDIKGFIIEYLTEKLVFPIHYTILPQERRVVDRFYGNKDIEDIVSSEERNGSVKRSIKKVKEFFIDAPDGSVAVMTSPLGLSGMKLNDGRPIIYPDSQTYIWKKQGNDVWGFTVKTDFNHQEHRELLRRLTFKSLPENADVTEYVEVVAGIIPGSNIFHGLKSVAFVSKERYSTPPKRGKQQAYNSIHPRLNRGILEAFSKTFDIKDVVDVMRDTRFDIGGTSFAFENRMWSEVYKDLERREELWRYDKKSAEIVNEFKEYFMTHELSKKEVQEALAVTILRISKFLRGERREEVLKKEPTMFHKRVQPLVTYGDVLEEVQKIPGCAGGGSSNNGIFSSVTPRRASLGEKRILCCTCPFCGLEVEAEIEGGVIKCPKCEKTAEWSDEQVSQAA